jgi:hypothetical protein
MKIFQDLEKKKRSLPAEAGLPAGSELKASYIRQQSKRDVIRHQVRLGSEFQADVVPRGANAVAEHPTINGADDGPFA